MAAPHFEDISSVVFRPLSGVGGRMARMAAKPLAAPVRVSTETGVRLARRTADRVLEGEELEHAVAVALNDARVQVMFRRTLDSEGAAQLIDTFFESGLFDRFVDRLLASDGLWRLVDEIVSSPAVRAALSQQGLGFVDQLGAAMRSRSRRGDRRLERAAERLTGGHTTDSARIPAEGDEGAWSTQAP